MQYNADGTIALYIYLGSGDELKQHLSFGQVTEVLVATAVIKTLHVFIFFGPLPLLFISLLGELNLMLDLIGWLLASRFWNY